MHKSDRPLYIFLAFVCNALLLADAAGSAVVTLNNANYHALTESKTVFVKFYAPWCAHCKRMAADWDRLAADWKDNEVGLVGEVDCTDHAKGGGKDLCNHFGIQAFPTLMYGHPSDLEEYEGETEYEELAAFAKENLVPLCSVGNLELCDDDMKATIQGYQGMSAGDLEELIKEHESWLEEAEVLFAHKVDELTKLYQAAEEERKQAIAEVVEKGDLGLMRSVILAKDRMKAKSDSDDGGHDVEAPKDEL